MANETQHPQPRNIFEVINLNVVDLSKDVVALFELMRRVEAKIDAVYVALYPPVNAPNDGGAQEDASQN